MHIAPWLLIGLTLANWIPASESAGTRGVHALLAIAWLVFAAIEFGMRACRGQSIAFARADAAALALAAWIAASAWMRSATADARTSLNIFWLFCSWVAAYLVARQRFLEAETCRAWALTLVLACVGQAAAGLYQHQVLQPRAWRDYQMHAETILASQGIPTEPGNIQRASFESRLRSNQPTGTFLHPNSLAGLLAIGIVLAASLGLSSTTNRQRVGWAVVTLSMTAVLYLTGGRAAMVATTLGLTALAWLEWPALHRRTWRIAAGLAVAACAVGLWLMVSPRAASAAKSLSMRTEYWRATVAMIGERPWFGCGLGNFQDLYAAVRPAAASEVVADPHNVWLELAAVCGLPALGLWMLFLTLSARLTWPIALASNTADAANVELVPGRSSGWRNAYTAALSGVAFGLLSAALRLRMPDLRLVGVGVLAAAIAAILVGGRASSGEAWKKGVWLAPWVLLLHLQVSGGVLYPGIAAPLWILLALGINLASIPNDSPVVSGRNGRILATGLAGAATIAAACAHFTMFRPMHLADARLAQAELAFEGGDLRLAARLAAEANRADPWSGAIARRWLELTWHSPSASDRTAAEQAARKLNPRSAALHGWLGNMRLLDHRRSGAREDLERAIVEYQAVVRLYPRSAVAWTQLAYALHLHGDRPQEMQEAAQEAWRLDQLQQHDEHKLTSQTLFDDPAPTGTALNWAERLKASPN